MKPTKQELRGFYYDQELSLAKIAKRFGVCRQTVLNWMKGYGIPRRTLSESWHNKTDEEKHLEEMWRGGKEFRGKDRWNWKSDGSRRMGSGGSAGYIQVKHNGEWVLEHRLVMEEYLGRSLKEGEEIHHKNQDKTDNRIENLALFENHSAHLRAFNHRLPPQPDDAATEHSDA